VLHQYGEVMLNLLMAVPITVFLASAYAASAERVMQGRVESSFGGSSPSAITLSLRADNTSGNDGGNVRLDEPYECTFHIQMAETMEGQTDYAITRSTGGFCDKLTSGRFSTTPGYNETHVVIFDKANIERLHGGVTPAGYQP
jgi:hypothetical protein